jgi:wyosine [tRNA(Phe)-imidazoG37] synthetase (radical SAM superfamily)
MKYIFGPVKSRRLGLSLGINIIPHKTCCFDCIYCQLGITTNKTIEQKEYVNSNEVISELKSFLQNQKIQKIDYITFSGTGEPSLNSKIGELISEIKKITDIPVAVITNSALLSDDSIRRSLLQADIILPTLSFMDNETFLAIHKPHSSLKFEQILNGLILLRREFKNKIWLEIMLVRSLNDNLKKLEKLKEIVDLINPDKIHLNVPVRLPKERKIYSPVRKTLIKIKNLFGESCEII